MIKNVIQVFFQASQRVTSPREAKHFYDHVLKTGRGIGKDRMMMMMLCIAFMIGDLHSSLTNVFLYFLCAQMDSNFNQFQRIDVFKTM